MAAAGAGTFLVADIAGFTALTEGSPTVRVGMHSGQAVVLRGDFFGGVVNLAARIAGIAAGRSGTAQRRHPGACSPTTASRRKTSALTCCATSRTPSASTPSAAPERPPSGRSTRSAGWRSIRPALPSRCAPSPVSTTSVRCSAPPGSMRRRSATTARTHFRPASPRLERRRRYTDEESECQRCRRRQHRRVPSAPGRTPRTSHAVAAGVA